MSTFDFVTSVAKYGALILLPYCFLVFSYRVFFHPLRNFPGPLAAKVSDFYAGSRALSRRLHLTTYLDLKKYGPVLRLGPNRLVFNSAEALQDIYNNERVTKSHVYQLTVSAGKPSIFNTIDKRRHRAKRKLIGQAISDKAMRDFEPVMLEQIDVFIRQLQVASSKGDFVDLTERLKQLGADIVGLLAFGYPLHMQTESTNRFVLGGLKIGAFQNNSLMQFPLLKKLGIHHLLPSLGYAERMKYLGLVRHMIGARLSQEKDAVSDLYSFVVDYLDKDNTPDGVKTEELWSEALFFFPAGGDTTSTAISALFFYLSRNPNAYKKLADEIRNTFQSNAEIRNGPQLASCRYLRGCIDEALRMSPPVGGTLWRELYAEERERGPFVVDGHVIPPGTQVGVSMYAIHHNEKYFADPFAFRPERWLVEDQATLSRMHSAFSPFSLGPRGCAGKSMAYLETSLVVSKTLWYFDFETAPGKPGEVGGGVSGRTDGRGRPGEFQLYDQFGSTHSGPNLVFHPRGDHWKEIDTKAKS
ncbi:cytochrome P450 [Hypoxylon sp. FL0543]|nr:cytochrome P450 [Hypoxylon sp. FL0543]